MAAMIAIIGESPANQYIRQIAGGGGLKYVSYETLQSLDVDVAQFRVVILLLAGKESNTLLDCISTLRLDLSYRGAIVLLSFAPIKWLLKQDGGEQLDTPGCLYLQLPFLLDEFAGIITRPVSLSDEEDLLANKKLRARQIALDAGIIRHDYENKFSLALAKLRELEKLSYFSGLNVSQVFKKFQQANLHLSRAKIKEFREEVTTFLEAAERWKGDELANEHKLLESWDALDRWLELNATYGTTAELNLGEIFDRAKQAQTAIRFILSVIKNLKEEARQVISHVQ